MEVFTLKAKAKAPRLKVRRRDLILTLMSSPAIILLVIFNYIPMFGLVLAFKDYRFDKGFLGSEWVGWDNFKFFFESNDAWIVLRNTLLLNMLFIAATLVMAVVTALIINEVRSRHMVKAAQTVMFFPYFMSWVVVGFLLYAFLQQDYGIINTLLGKLGLEKVSWYTQASYWPVILVISFVWKNMGYNSVIYYSSIIGFDASYYEAAEIDGATRLQMTTRITLPLLQPVVIVMLILQIGRIMYADFGLFYQLTRNQGALYATTDVLDTYVFRALRVTGDVGIGTAVGAFQAVVGMLLILGTNAIVRRIDEDSALF